MIIVDKRENGTPCKFSKLAAGDVFEREGHVYCKLNDIVCGSGFNVVDLITYGLDYLYPNDDVFELIAALEIWNASDG